MKPDQPTRKTRISLIEDVCALIDLSAQQKMVLTLYARYANPDGFRAYPSRELLATLTKLSTRQVDRIIKFLVEDKKYLVPDGKLTHVNRYRVDVPDRSTGKRLAEIFREDISKEEWEAMMQPDLGDDDSPTDKRQVVKPPDDDATVKAPVVKPPPAVPTTPITNPLQQNREFIQNCLNLIERGIMTRETFIKRARIRGFTDDYLEWLFRGGGGSDSLLGSQPSESPEETAIIPEGLYQP